MPTLKTYTAPLGGLPASGGRRASAEDFGSDGLTAAAHTTRKVANSFLADAEEKESRKALVESSELRAKYARRLDEATLDGSDTAKIKEEMQADFAKIGEGFSTKKGVDSVALYSANTDIMFDEQANRIAVQRAAATARIEGAKFLNNSASILRSTPSYLPEAEKDADAFAATLTGVSPSQRAEIAQKLKNELNAAAAVASARIDPEGTKTKLEAGAWDLTPDQREQAIARADTEVRAKRVNDEYLRAQAEREQKEANDKARDEHFATIMAGQPARRAIMDDARLTPATREHLITFMEHRAKELKTQEKVSDQATKLAIWLRVNAPSTDPRKIFNGDPIFEAVDKGLLNTTDADRFNMQIANMKDENNRSFGVRLQGRINTVAAAMRVSPEYSAQPELAAAIQLEMIAQVEKKAGEFVAEKKDRNALLDPESKDYYFKPNLIKSVAEDVKQRANAALPSITPISTQAEYDALEPGTPYVDSKGTRGVKPKPKAVPVKPVGYAEALDRLTKKPFSEPVDRVETPFSGLGDVAAP